VLREREREKERKREREKERKREREKGRKREREKERKRKICCNVHVLCKMIFSNRLDLFWTTTLYL